MQCMKRILVTGGAGFIGNHLCRELLAHGHHVICVDNLYTGSKDNLKDLFSNPNFTFLEHDVILPFDPGKVDQIYSLACPASPVHYATDPIFTARTNFLGSLNLLELAKKYKARILLASTSEIYGDPLEHPQPESYRGNVNPIGPRACYDEGKRISETLFFDHNRMHKTDIRVVRIFNTYGPNMDPADGRVVSNFITQALANKPLTIYGGGTQTRSFCYVADTVQGLIRMMERSYVGPVNLGNPGEFTVLELAQLVKAMTGSKSEIVFKPLPIDDPVKRKPDITLAKQELHWAPEIQLKEGLVKTIEHFKSINAKSI
jgi:UDP-glucuronate decarboxylase